MTDKERHVELFVLFLESIERGKPGLILEKEYALVPRELFERMTRGIVGLQEYADYMERLEAKLPNCPQKSEQRCSLCTHRWMGGEFDKCPNCGHEK